MRSRCRQVGHRLVTPSNWKVSKPNRYDPPHIESSIGARSRTLASAVGNVRSALEATLGDWPDGCDCGRFGWLVHTESGEFSKKIGTARRPCDAREDAHAFG